MTSLNLCPLCESASASVFSGANNKIYYRCNECRLIFLDEKFFLPHDEEKLRYEFHNNDPLDKGYISHLEKLTNKLLPLLDKTLEGLDYGCGKGKAVEHILKEHGINVSCYDPFFFNDKSLLGKKYNFITCTETIEHFHDPAEEFDRVNSILEAGGILGIMTNFYNDEIDFDDWWYTRDPTHTCFYSKETMSFLSAKYNWKFLHSNNIITIFKKLL